MRKLIALFPVMLMVACIGRKDIAKDGGVRITMEVSPADLLRASMYPNDSLAHAIIDETYKSGAKNAVQFFDIYFDKLEKADGLKPAVHFNIKELPMTSSAKEVKEFFRQKLEMDSKRVEKVLGDRLDKYGASATIIPNPEMNRIVIEIAGQNDMQRLRKLLQTSANIEFWETWSNEEMYPLLTKLNTELGKLASSQPGAAAERTTASEEKQTKADHGLNEQLAESDKLPADQQREMDSTRAANPVFALLTPKFKYNERNQPVGFQEGPVVGFAEPKDTGKINAMLRTGFSKRFFKPYTRLYWTAKSAFGAEKRILELVALKGDRFGARLSGDIITDAHVSMQNGYPEISMTMNTDGAKEWQAMTRENIGRSIAMVVDEQVYSYPNVLQEITGGVSSITGNYTSDEAMDLATILKAGSLPVPARIIAEEVVPPAK